MKKIFEEQGTMTAADLLLAQPQMTEDERVDAILNGELVGINYRI